MSGIVVTHEEVLKRFEFVFMDFDKRAFSRDGQLNIIFEVFDNITNTKISEHSVSLRGQEAKSFLLNYSNVSDFYLALCNNLDLDSDVVPNDMNEEL